MDKKVQKTVKKTSKNAYIGEIVDHFAHFYNFPHPTQAQDKNARKRCKNRSKTHIWGKFRQIFPLFLTQIAFMGKIYGQL